jgi:hypothetical protein
MTFPEAATHIPIDYWRAITRRGVQSLGFSVRRTLSGPALVAELTEPLAGWVRRAALAAIVIHDLAANSIEPPIAAARAVLTMALERGAASDPLKLYQDLLAEAVWVAVQDDPPRRLEALSADSPFRVSVD